MSSMFVDTLFWFFLSELVGGLSPDWGHYILCLGKTLCFCSTPVHDQGLQESYQQIEDQFKTRMHSSLD